MIPLIALTVARVPQQAPSRSAQQAGLIANDFIKRAGLKEALRRAPSASREERRARHAFWTFTYDCGDSQIEVGVYDSASHVSFFERSWKTRAGLSKAFASRDMAIACLHKWAAKLDLPYATDLEVAESDIGRIYPGAVTAHFAATAKRHRFIDRAAGVSMSVLPSSELLSFIRTADPPPTREPMVKLNSREAFGRVRPELEKLPKFLDVGSGKPQIDQWHPTLGWYLPKGKKLCELGWRFQYRVGGFYYIVNAATGAVQRPVITG